MLPQIGIRALVEKQRPTVIICDIDGGELGLFDGIDLSSVRAPVIELHPRDYRSADEDTADHARMLAAARSWPRPGAPALRGLSASG